MKRTRWVVTVTLLLCAGVAAWSAPGMKASTHQARTVVDHLARAGRMAVNAAVRVAVPAAIAQETLEFKEVPPESVPKPRERRRRRATTTTPSAPSVPKIDVDVDAPRVIVGQSGDVMKIGSDIHVEEDQVISGDVLAVGASVEVDGHVEGNVVSMGGDIELSATARVDGDVVCMGGKLREDPGSFIGGQRVTTGGFNPGVVFPRRSVRIGDGVGDAIGWMIWLLILVGLAWAFTRMAPGSTGSALEMLQERTALSLGIGALVWALMIPSLIAVVLVVAFLCITIIGIPLALALLFGYFLFVALLCAWGFVVGMAAIGNLILRRVTPAPIASATPPPTKTIPPASGEAPTPAAPAAPAAAVPAAVEHSLTRKAIVGVLVVGGLELAGRFLKVFDFVPPLNAIGNLFDAVASLTTLFATTFGIGAWLRAEFASGTLGRWWSGRRNPMRRGTPVDAGAPAPPPPSAPPAQS